jgi:hypothetical protein
MPFRVHANMNGSALTVIVETAKEARAKMTELVELGCADVMTRDLEARRPSPSRNRGGAKMITRLAGIALSALMVMVSQARAGDLHCTGVFSDQRKVGLSLGVCDLTKISPYDFEKIVGVCGEPNGVDKDANKTTCNVVGVGARNVVKRILSVKRTDP